MKGEGLLGEGRLVAIDERYVVLTHRPDIQMRLAVSYGPNITKDMSGGILPPPVQEAKFVFGVHQVGIKGNRLVILGGAQNPSDTRGRLSEARILTEGRRLLRRIEDEKYKELVKESPEDEVREFGLAAVSRPWEEVSEEEL
jgi:hypothetical protein